MVFSLPGPRLGLLLGLLWFATVNQAARCDDSIGNSLVPPNCSEVPAVPPAWGIQTRILDLSYKNITSISRSNIPYHTSCVNHLNLSHNQIQEIHDGALSGLPHLKELDLNSNQLQTVTQKTWLGLLALEVLDLRHNLLAAIASSAFDGLRSLRMVLLQDNRLTAIPEALCRLTGLRVFALAGNRITSVGMPSLRPCTGVQELHLERNRISEVFVEAFQGLDNLKILNLSFNLLEAVPAITIQALQEQGIAVDLHGNPRRRSCDPTDCSSGLNGTAVRSLHEDTALILPCGHSSRGEVLYWQTPFGQWQNSRGHDKTAPLEILANGSLKIGRPTPHHNGLYYCLFQEGEGQGLLPYRVWYGAARLQKSRDTREYRKTVSQSQFAAVVVASVTVTFLVAFSLGAFSRTYLERCFQKLKAKQTRETPGEKMYTLPTHHKKTIFRKDPSTSNEGFVSIDESTPPKKAPRTTLTKKREGDDSGQEKPSREDIHPQDMVPKDCSHHSESALQSGPREVTRGQTDDSTEELQEARPRPAKRRAIKLYHYDEDGNPFNHVGDLEEASREPSARQRSLSLSRLNNIMSAATTLEQ